MFLQKGFSIRLPVSEPFSVPVLLPVFRVVFYLLSFWKSFKYLGYEQFVYGIEQFGAVAYKLPVDGPFEGVLAHCI